MARPDIHWHDDLKNNSSSQPFSTIIVKADIFTVGPSSISFPTLMFVTPTLHTPFQACAYGSFLVQIHCTTKYFCHQPP